MYEREGNEVIYNGAVNGAADLGRDLIVKCDNETLIIQAKCWAKHRVIQEKHIFQLFGSMSHFDLTSNHQRPEIRAVFYTTAKYGEVARDVARVLGVELRTEWLNRSYPMIKCSVSVAGEKNYYLPFDPQYDKVKIEYRRGDCFAETVKEAVAKGFVRPQHNLVRRREKIPQFRLRN